MWACGRWEVGGGAHPHADQHVGGINVIRELPIEGPPRKSPHTLIKVWKRPVTRAVPGVDMRGLSKDTAPWPTGVDLRMGWTWAEPKQMALIHNCLVAGQVGLEPINLIELIRYVARCPLGGQDVQGGSPRGRATLAVFATCLPACCHLLTFHYIYFTGHNCKVDEWICRLMSPRG
uniref:GG14473 n=1 Tax=Drosophila erecta TaxID=7220 RepID=B3NZZ2_DROER